ncbi:lactosylceramide 4-alpha-galactosyltransferase-like [Drosophila subobscura]|uniref:lactosylceramide 4-alpha-galactosyltransferase-like n=1 Tax=Drosophila subobscura TaxID=7241 RepID=UPI00155A3E6D|nr:lactosylceramide 4-alpha-galactosyltransferase-like [Drosophila subobscura]
MLLRFHDHGRLRLLFIVLIVILTGGICLTYNWPNKEDAELMPQPIVASVEPLASIRVDDVLLALPRPTPGRSIFFHETRSYDAKNKEYNHPLKLNARQACAIESAALHNPNSQVFVLFVHRKYLLGGVHSNESKKSTEQPLFDAILSYSNVHLRRVNLWRYAAGTPIEEWLKNSQLFRSRFAVSHISDFLRFLTLFRYGGLYLDLDVVVLKSMEDVPPNYTGADPDDVISSAVISLTPTGFGHKIAESLLYDFQHNFNGLNWAGNGPGVMTRVAQKICGTKNISVLLENRNRCLGFQVFDSKAFYAVPFRHWKHFFQPHRLEETMAAIKDSYVAHVWNRRSVELKIKVGSSSAYAQLAELHCPRVYESAGEYF